MKENLLEFYVNKFCFADSLEDIDISFIPPILRRKTTNIDKVALSLMNKTYSEDIQNIVFSSQFGEVERLLKIIDQYTIDKETSPNVFSASVHNYPVSFFLLNIKKSIPYTALSGTNSTITMSLITSVVSDYNNTLFCFCDVNKGKTEGLALNISKKPVQNADKYILSIKNEENKTDDFRGYVELFNKNTNYLETPLYIIERAG